MTDSRQLRGRYAHAPGPTLLTYTPDGTRLITAGVDPFCRIFTTGSDDEPINVDDCQENNTAIAASNDFFILGSEDGTVSKYSLKSHQFEEILVRSTLPIRDVALSPDGKWAAVASDELVVYVVNTDDMMRVKKLREQNRSVKHVAYNSTGTQLAVSCTDGNIYIYAMDQKEPELVKKIDGLIKSLESEAESSSKVIWHPNGEALAAPTGLREIQVISLHDWAPQKSFQTGHSADISAAAWSPNGALLATTSSDLQITIWDAITQKQLASHETKATILAMHWHPKQNLLSYTNTDGHLYMHTDFVPEPHVALLSMPMQPAPFFHQPSEGRSRKAVIRAGNGTKSLLIDRKARDGSPDSLDDLLGPELQDGERDQDMDDFIVDDDGAGYADAVNGHGKRTNGHLDLPDTRAKRRPHKSAFFQPQIHEPFQPGATPWRGSRRLLCCSLVGYVSTISQEGSHHTVEVKFYDEHTYRNFHFTDIYLYDKACLNANGALFACPPNQESGTPAMVYYRPHETWTARTDWRTNLPTGESVAAIALSENYVVITTTANYVRIFSLFGLPIRVYRQKASPSVSCAAWRDYVMTVGNGPVGGDGTSQLVYTIENVKHDEVYQSEDVVALPPNTTLTSVFFSEEGDPYIYDSDGVLLTLLRWRTNGQARWVPMLDTKCLSRLAGGGKEETYWPISVGRDMNGKHVFHCMIIKGSERYPTCPPPMLSEFPLEIPLSSSMDKAREREKEHDSDAMSDGEDGPSGKADNKQQEYEQDYIMSCTLQAQLSESLANTRPTADQRQDLAKHGAAINGALLRLLGFECLAGEDRGMKAFELVRLMSDDGSGKMLELAGKVAQKYGRDLLGQKIRELAEDRQRARIGLDDDDF